MRHAWARQNSVENRNLGVARAHGAAARALHFRSVGVARRRSSQNDSRAHGAFAVGNHAGGLGKILRRLPENRGADCASNVDYRDIYAAALPCIRNVRNQIAQRRKACGVCGECAFARQCRTARENMQRELAYFFFGYRYRMY